MSDRKFKMKRDPETLSAVRQILKTNAIMAKTVDVDSMSDELVIETVERAFNGFYDAVVPALQVLIRAASAAAGRFAAVGERLREIADDEGEA